MIYKALNIGYDLTPNIHLIGNLIANNNRVGHFEKSKKLLENMTFMRSIINDLTEKVFICDKYWKVYCKNTTSLKTMVAILDFSLANVFFVKKQHL